MVSKYFCGFWERNTEDAIEQPVCVGVGQQQRDVWNEKDRHMPATSPFASEAAHVFSPNLPEAGTWLRLDHLILVLWMAPLLCTKIIRFCSCRTAHKIPHPRTANQSSIARRQIGCQVPGGTAAVPFRKVLDAAGPTPPCWHRVIEL